MRAGESGRVRETARRSSRADGKLIVRILLPESAANLAFGGASGKTLFLTARKSLYSVETLVRDGKKGKRRYIRSLSQFGRHRAAGDEGGVYGVQAFGHVHTEDGLEIAWELLLASLVAVEDKASRSLRR